MSLIQYHGEQSPSIRNQLTKYGIVKNCNEEYSPILHLPLSPFSYHEGMYDVGIYKRWESLRFSLLPSDLKGAFICGENINSYHVYGLIFNYGNDQILVDSQTGSIYDGFDEDTMRPTLAPRVAIFPGDPVGEVVKRQFFRIGDYCNFAYTLYEVEAHVYWDPSPGGEVRVVPMEITPYVGEIFQHFPQVGGTPLFKKLEKIVAAYEGI